jgi:DNA-binding protein H-NS
LFLEHGEDDYFKQTIEDMMKCTKDTIAEKNLLLEDLTEKITQLEIQKEDYQQSSIDTLQSTLLELHNQYGSHFKYLQDDLIPSIEEVERDCCACDQEIKQISAFY